MFLPNAGRSPCLHLFANCTLLLRIKLFNTKKKSSDQTRNIISVTFLPDVTKDPEDDGWSLCLIFIKTKMFKGKSAGCIYTQTVGTRVCVCVCLGWAYSACQKKNDWPTTVQLLNIKITSINYSIYSVIARYDKFLHFFQTAPQTHCLQHLIGC